MATERATSDSRLTAQASILKRWGQEWRKANGKSQQDLGRAAGYGSDESPKSAAVAISRIESGKTDPAGRYRERLLHALGRTAEELDAEVEQVLTTPARFGIVTRALAGPVHLENDVRRARIIADSNELTKRVESQIQDSERALERARESFIVPFLDTAAAIDWEAFRDGHQVEDDDGGAGAQAIEIRGLWERMQVSVLRTLAEGAAGAVVGVGVGAGTAASVLAVVSATATASTGTAIASLSGAAASSATLAWLGGGSLAAGGMGVAGGTALLTGVVALPALLAVGAALVWKGRRLRQEATAEAEKLDAAQQALEEMQSALPRAEEWSSAQRDIVRRVELIGRTIHARNAISFQRFRDTYAVEGKQIAWGDLSPDIREALEVELKLLGIALAIRALPVWLGVTSICEPELTSTQEASATQSEEWVHESLVLAQYEIDEQEEWVRELISRDAIK